MPRILAIAALSALLGGCVVAEPPHHPPVGVAYIEPTYAIPAPGYVWRYHAVHGWGWWHPHYGWHRGWR